MVDGQGRALGSGSIPGVSPRRLATPKIHFFTVPRRNAGHFGVKKDGKLMNKMVEYLKRYFGRKTMKAPRGKEIIDFLNEKWHGTTCPLCGGREWTVSEEIFELREFNDGNMVIGGNSKILPVIPVTCKNCGNTVFISAISTGLLKE